ncbi:hypothetical protein SR1949_10440 [Sphaerospermopsis reniformis]|uniref:Uncharacterized protein n=1 Tax=Sphaerospermopsis reniformis TaxID=531300 RepID=A0A480A1E6_9CYAN|nr:hypothetical protein SR1949_10440 [Sphaerospermopsis reniformis]
MNVNLEVDCCFTTLYISEVLELMHYFNISISAGVTVSKFVGWVEQRETQQILIS